MCFHRQAEDVLRSGTEGQQLTLRALMLSERLEHLMYQVQATSGGRDEQRRLRRTGRTAIGALGPESCEAAIGAGKYWGCLPVSWRALTEGVPARGVSVR